jgi:CheY-like chemotaxis protein
VIVLAAIIGRFFVDEQQKALDAEVRGKAGIMAASVQRELKAQMKLLAILGESPRLDPPISTRAFAEIARRMREQMPEWEQIRISDSEGKVVLAVPEIDNVGKLKIVDMASHDFVVRHGAPTIGNIAIGQGGKAAFAVRVPIRRKDKVRAVLSVVMRPSIITDFLYANGLPSLWSAWIVDGQDRLVASTGGPALAGGEASGFASFTGTDFGTGRLIDGTQLRVAEIALEDTPWTVRVGIPRSEYEALSRKASMLLVAASFLHDTPNTASLALPRSIMIVDDTAASLESVRLLLEPLIPSVITASDGIQALDLLGKHPGLEAVLSDILMPSMSGIELAAKISQFDRRLPVVLMTGYSDKLEEGADVGRPVVAKPFMVGEFSEAFVKAKASLDADNIIRLNVEGR